MSKRYNKIKDAVIAGLASGLYCYSCFTVEGHNTSTIIFGALCMFGFIYLAMREIDERIKAKAREKRVADVLQR